MRVVTRGYGSGLDTPHDVVTRGYGPPPAPPTDEAFGGYGPLLRIRRHDDEGDILAVISAFTTIQQEESWPSCRNR